MSASFQIYEDGFTHQIKMPDVTPPEKLMSEEQMQAAFLAKAPASIRKYWANKRPIEIRPVSLTHYISRKNWSRTRISGSVPLVASPITRIFSPPFLPISQT